MGTMAAGCVGRSATRMPLSKMQVLQDAWARHYGVPNASGEAEVNPNGTRRNLVGANKCLVGDKRGSVAYPRPDAKKPTHPTQREVVVTQSCAIPRDGVAAEHNHAIPRWFIPMSDQAMQEFSELTSIIGEIQPGHENTTKEKIVAGLCALSLSLRNHDWKLYKDGNSDLTCFPSSTGLEVALCRTSIPCRGYDARFRVVGWGNEEGVRWHKFPSSP